MTALAQERELADQHPLVVGTMRVMTRDAALRDRRVLPQVRSALVRMTRLAALIDRRSGLQQPDVAAAMRVVARRALHRAFAYRHVAEAIVLVHHRLMTPRAGLISVFFTSW